jgi:hypothetical protein
MSELVRRECGPISSAEVVTAGGNVELAGVREACSETGVPGAGMRDPQRWILFALFGVMAVLQLSLIGRQSLWVDEAFSLAIATGHSLEHPAAAADPTQGDFVETTHPVPAQELQHYLQHDHPPAAPSRVIRAVLLSDTSPPLYYLLLYVWTLLLGTSDAILRFFSVVWSLACFPVLANVARRTGGPTAVLPSCVLFALSPLGLYFATEGRMYSLLLFCALTTAFVSLSLAQDGGKLTRYFWWIAASSAGFLTHYFFLFPWAAMTLYLLIFPGKSKRRGIIISILVLALAISPWYLAAFGYLSHWRVTEGWLHLRPDHFNRLRTMRNQLLQFFSSGGSGLWRYERWSSYAAIAIFGLVAMAAGWRLRLRAFAGPRLLLWMWLIASCGAPIVIDALQHTYLTSNPRYTIDGLPAACLVAGIGLGALKPRIRIPALILILFAWTMPVVNIYLQRSRSGDPLKLLAGAVNSEAHSTDLILIHSIPSGVLGVARYTNGSLNMASWVGPLGTRHVPDSLLTLAGGRKRIRLVKVHLLREPLPEEEWLRTNAVLSDEVSFDYGSILDFRPTNSGAF